MRVFIDLTESLVIIINRVLYPYRYYESITNTLPISKLTPFIICSRLIVANIQTHELKIIITKIWSAVIPSEINSYARTRLDNRKLIL